VMIFLPSVAASSISAASGNRNAITAAIGVRL
jgi:hypothetical protein